MAAASQGLPLVVHEAELARRMLDQLVQHSPGGSQFHDGNGLKRTSPRREALLLGVMAIKTKALTPSNPRASAPPRLPNVGRTAADTTNSP